MARQASTAAAYAGGGGLVGGQAGGGGWQLAAGGRRGRRADASAGAGLRGPPAGVTTVGRAARTARAASERALKEFYKAAQAGGFRDCAECGEPARHGRLCGPGGSTCPNSS